MSPQWEYQVLTVRRGGMLKLSNTPQDAELTAILNREGAQGWELVNAITPDDPMPTTPYLKRPR
ncbi:MAG: DUF4177 domain-containing protein [Rhodanobacter sp.]|nr:MAG: DUF4177 domain-containing protein [Rhodanobacter sp.]TAM14518.1 MAG: DUF4177 domain-containing protein [Rhodanobacter sp.]TAM37309.1 MAG: DUF4177 domain-containing protein [Rhodanobacter sp.]